MRDLSDGILFMMNLIYAIPLFALFVVLSIADILITRKILSQGGKELNPFAKIFGLWWGKLISVVGVGVVYIIFRSLIILAIANVITLATVVWNYVQLRK